MEIGNDNARAISNEFHSFTARDVRVGYVMRHFWEAHQFTEKQCITVSIGGRYPTAPVQIDDNAAGFFDAEAPYPPAPVWHEWQGHQIPFFFGPPADTPLLELLPDRRAVIHFDLISAVFYLLSGWQEYFSEERDQHGRFPYAASVQHKYGFVAVPVVNYYFDVLKMAVEHVTGQPLPVRRWPNDAPFATFVTHDIDSLRSAWKAPAKAALQRRDWQSFGRQLWQHFTQKDAWNNLLEVKQAVAEFNAKSTFFLLPSHRKAPNGTPNADYRLSAVWPRVGADIGFAEVGLHGSIGTAGSAARLQHEKQKLQRHVAGKVTGIRFHYLCWEPRTTPVMVDKLEFAYDSTLGFAEHFGFRNSYCRPFYPYDFARGGYCRFLEIPLNVMDATLHHPRYLQLASEEILPALQPMFKEIERFGGVCTLLWHNDHFDPANETTGPRQFRELMHYLRSRNTAFVNGQEICAVVKL